jgi:hypothetical protein
VSQPRSFCQINVLVGFAIFLLAFCRPSSANVIHVTTLSDKVSSSGGCSLKEAIYSSTLHDTLDGVHGIAISYTDPDHFITTGCEIGTGNDTIILPTGFPLPTFQLTTDTSWDAHNPYGPTATPIINSNITIQGFGGTLQWAGTGHVRLFAVGPATITTPNGVSSGTGSLTLINVHVTGFQAKGGDGAAGGGGGLGAGGAIYIQSGNLTIQDSTFDSNVATGGVGGDENVAAGGGGGGLGGNGGNAIVEYTTGGGGGGGSRGNGGDATESGGGGGGTETNGDNPGSIDRGVPGGYLCGGDGGAVSNNGNSGDNGKCAGGGGGGGGFDSARIIPGVDSGGNGAYGGGGGGGPDQGGNGGFGGGGGAVGNPAGGQGGNGGFGGGGGSGTPITPFFGDPGQGGAFGGRGDVFAGGGGAALGGAIFSDNATIVIENSTFSNNSLVDGQGGIEGNARADNGGAAGAIFARDGSLTIIDSTISGNLADGSGAGLVVYGDGSATFTLDDTILANNGANECYIAGNVSTSGAGNLIMSNSAGGSFNPCPGVVATGDPQLGPLQLNPPGITPTMAISTASTAFNAADPTTSLSKDQRGVDRPQDGGFDIGAYEACTPPNPHNPNEITCVVLQNAPPPESVNLTVLVRPANAGTTSPAAGITSEVLGSVVIAKATPNPGYYFYEWTGGPFNTSEYVDALIMNSAATIEANFLPCGCATDVTGSVAVTRGAIVLNPVTKMYAETVTVKNSSAKTLTGPISLVLQNLSSNAVLAEAIGTTRFATPLGSPYVAANVNLAPGQSVSFALQFGDEGNAPISFTARVLAGPGAI